MLDFTSALYLGWRHATGDLAPWEDLSTGRPAALDPPESHGDLRARLAALPGCERALVAPSTLHAFCDLGGALSRLPVELCLDEGVYPIARWGALRALAASTPVRTFAHHRPEALREALARGAAGSSPWRARRMPVVVTDGWCPGCQREAPLTEVLAIVRERGGLVVIDDTQAIGVSGAAPDGAASFGRGGGGSAARQGLSGPDVLVIASLAKAFGVPMTLLAGSARVIDWLERESDSRAHSSPPSVATLRAAARALRLNEREGDARRARLHGLLRRLRRRLGEEGVRVGPGLFPAQSLVVPGVPAAALHEGMLARGVRTVLSRARCTGVASVSLLVTARHTEAEIDEAARAAGLAMQNGGRDDVPVRH